MSHVRVWLVLISPTISRQVPSSSASLSREAMPLISQVPLMVWATFCAFSAIYRVIMSFYNLNRWQCWRQACSAAATLRSFSARLSLRILMLRAQNYWSRISLPVFLAILAMRYQSSSCVHVSEQRIYLQKLRMCWAFRCIFSSQLRRRAETSASNSSKRVAMCFEFLDNSCWMISSQLCQKREARWWRALMSRRKQSKPFLRCWWGCGIIFYCLGVLPSNSSILWQLNP